MLGQPTGIPTVGSKNVAKMDDRDAMPPPSLIGRSQSIRRPVVQTKLSGISQAGSSRVPMSPQRTSLASSKGEDKPEPIATTTPSPLHRSASTRIPGSSTSVTQQSLPTRPLHGRTQSVATSPSVRNAGFGLARSNTTASMHARSRSSISSESIKASPLNQPLGKPASTNECEPPIKRRATVTKITSGASLLGPSKVRPNFNTLQQHYSPAKPAPRPPVPSSRMAPSAEESSATSSATFETTKFQSELLYLSLLHQSSERTLLDYRASADKALREEYSSLQHEQELFRQAERSYQEVINVGALVEWAGFSNGDDIGRVQHFAEIVRCLSSCINELTGLSGPEGRYSRLVQEFTAWIMSTNAGVEEEHGRSGNYAQVFVEALSEDWHDSHISISQRLRLLERDIESLPPSPAGPENKVSDSALVKIIVMLRSSTLCMRQELDTMLVLEKRVLSNESERVEEAISRIHLEVLQDRSIQPAAWNL